MADITTGTTATTTQDEEIVIGGIWVSTANATVDAGNVTLDQKITNSGVEQLVTFAEVKSATGAFHGDANWDGSAPLSVKYAGCIITYKVSDAETFIPKIIFS